MTDIPQPKLVQTWITSPKSAPAAVSRRHTVNIWALTLLSLGVISTIVWVVFLGWCVLSVV